jgi:hypothetical protein
MRAANDQKALHPQRQEIEYLPNQKYSILPRWQGNVTQGEQRPTRREGEKT